MAKRRIGPFEIEKKLGVGGMGIVYLSTYLKTGQQVALKVLSPQLTANEKVLSRFEREMDILKKLQHKHIVRYFWGGTIKGQHLYAMEIMDAGSVEDWLKRKGRLSWEQTVDCARHICKALEYAHNAGVIHRDLKPANLFLSKKGYLKLGDFGIARDNQATALTAAGSTVGTYAYMAPEQITGASPITRKTDLYALGCVMYELLTGRTPFQGETMVEMLQQHLNEEPPRIISNAIDCPVWLESLVIKLLEKNPEDRYFDALAVQIALDEVVEKVTKQQSVAKQTLEGDGNATVAGDAKELKKSIRKKKKKKKKKGPFYEQVWFLALCLCLVIGFIAWGVWPLSEEQLYARAAELMKSDSISDWRTAREEFIEPLLAKHPESQYRAEAEGWIDRIEMDLAERQIDNRRDRGRDPDSAMERLYVDALEFEEFGDLAMAEAKYHQILTSIDSADSETRPLYLLAKRQREQITSKWEQSKANEEEVPSSQEFVQQKLETAENYFRAEKLDKAREIWIGIRELYRGNSAYFSEVEQARARLDGRPWPPRDAPEEPPAN